VVVLLVGLNKLLSNVICIITTEFVVMLRNVREVLVQNVRSSKLFNKERERERSLVGRGVACLPGFTL